MFLPVITPTGLVEVWLASEQSSNAGSRSPKMVPRPLLFGGLTLLGSATGWPVLGLTAYPSPSLPEITLSAPGVDGPKFVS